MCIKLVIKTILEIKCLDWIHLAVNRDQCQAIVFWIMTPRIS
jgi:hypothetical protein